MIMKLAGRFFQHVMLAICNRLPPEPLVTAEFFLDYVTWDASTQRICREVIGIRVDPSQTLFTACVCCQQRYLQEWCCIKMESEFV